MSERESIFSTSIRAFLKTFFAFLGICAGLIALLLFLGLFSSSEEKHEITPKTKPAVLFNPDGTRKPLKSDSPLILQIDFNGVVGMGNLTIDKMRNLLDESQSKPLSKGRVKALFLNINSPGGGAFDSDAIYRLLMEYKNKYETPVFAYTERILASGGYYIAVAADKIYSSPIGIIGSVGVIVPTVFNVSKLLDKFDIETFTLSEGKYKDALNPTRSWTPEDKEYLKPMIHYFYETFLDVVSERRPALTKDVLINVTGARVFAPPMAKDHGYIDEIVPSQAHALAALAQAAHLEGESYQVVTLEQLSWLEQLFGDEASSLAPLELFYNWVFNRFIF